MVINADWLNGYLEAVEELQPDLVFGPVEPWFEEPPEAWLTTTILDSVTSAYSRKGEKLMLLPPARGHEVPGNFAVLRRAAEEVGGFHPKLSRCGKGMLAGADTEFGEKLVLLGKRVAYAPRCGIRHFISRKKLSNAGLRARWEGLGASRRARMRLRGDEPSLMRKFRLFARMNRFFLWSFRCRLAGDLPTALHWELKGLGLRGFLFKCPRGIDFSIDGILWSADPPRGS